MNKTCVVTATDRDFVVPTEVMLRSLDANYSGEHKLDVYVLVPEKMKNWEFSGTKFENIVINIVSPQVVLGEDAEEVADQLWARSPVSRITGASMYRFYMADIARSYKKAVYIDADCIIARDITPLLDYELYAPLAAFPEIQLDYSGNPAFRDAAYFNSGVMVVDLHYWRSQQVGKKLLKLIETFTNWTGASDQDLLNVVYRNKWTALPMDFNYLLNIYVNIDLKDPLVVHWAGKQKPWLSNSPDTKWKRLWRQYKNQSPTTT